MSHRLQLRARLVIVGLLASPALAQAAQIEPRYAIEGGQLVRWSDEVRGELGCTSSDGTGTVHGFARSPMGNVYVAAERGVFVISDASEHLDPLPLFEGAPVGPVIGVAVPVPRRVWFATERELVVIDAYQFFGHVLGPADGLPAPPYRGLRAEGAGEIVLAADAGEFRIPVRERSRCEIELASVAGRPFQPQTLHELAGDELALELVVRGDPRASLRWRDSRHANWYPLEREQPRIEHLEPGEHQLLLAAFDAELVQSESIALRVSVPYPRGLAPRTAVPIAAGIALAIALAFALRAARTPRLQRSWTRALVSAALVIVLAAQVVAAIFPHARGWPFVGFAMYTHTVEPFSHSYRDVLYGVPKRGARFEVDLWGFGMGQFEFRRRLVPAIHGGERERAALLDELNQRFYRGNLSGYEIVVERYRLTEHGPTKVAPLELVAYTREPADEAR